jgi:uncharacterized membrane protein
MSTVQPPRPPVPAGTPAHGSASGHVGHHTATPAQLSWLQSQLGDWQAEGLVDTTTAEAIGARYVAARRVTLVRIVLGLGAAFVAIGLIWLVAANLDQFSPGARFGFVTVVWLALVVVADLLAAHAETEHDIASPVVGAARLLAASSFAAVVFQAAQSLQVPAYEASLLGYSALGALLYAYAVRGLAPLTLAVGGLAVWFLWHVTAVADSMLAFVVAALVGAVVAASVATAHRARWRPDFAPPWREIGAAVALVGLFVAAIPRSQGGALTWSASLVVGLVVAALLVAGVLVVGDRSDRAEVALAAGALVVGVALSVWTTNDLDTTNVGAVGYARAAVAVAAFLLVATGYAALGALRDSARLTVVATIAVVVFVTFQAFAVFAPIISGSALFLATGVVLIVSGVLADRGRRRLLARVEEDLAKGEPS